MTMGMCDGGNEYDVMLDHICDEVWKYRAVDSPIAFCPFSPEKRFVLNQRAKVLHFFGKPSAKSWLFVFVVVSGFT